MPRPPVRAVDAGPVLPVRRVLRPRRASSRASGRARRSSTPASTAARSTHPKTGHGVDPPTCPYGDEPDVEPRPAYRQEASPTWLTSKDNPLFAKQLRQPRVELLLRPRHHRPGRRHPRQQPAGESGTARRADRRTSSSSGFDVRHLMRTIVPVADVSASIRAEQVERGRQDQLQPRHAAAADAPSR